MLMTMVRRKLWWLLPPIVLLVAELSLGRGRSHDGYAEQKVVRGPVVQAVYGIGTVTANHVFSLRVGVTSTISNLWVKEGDTVPAGARLLTVDRATTFRAPFGGTVTSLPVKVGETVFPQTPLLVLTDLKDLYLIVSLEQQAAVLVRPGQTAAISFENLRDIRCHGVVRSLYSNAGQFLVDIRSTDLPPAILPDMTADVGIQINVHPNALVVPVAAVDENSILLRRGRRTRRTPVGVGLVDADRAEIVSGDIQEGDVVLVPEKRP